MSGILKISEGANLALHSLAYLAFHEQVCPLPVNRIATALGVSKDHLGKVLQRLSRQGFILSRRGPRGGFSLGQETRNLTLLEIIEAVDGPLGTHQCLMENPICIKKCCVIGELMGEVNRDVCARLTQATLEDLLPAFQ